MLKKIKLKNSTILFSGFLLIALGFFLGGLEYFETKKDKAFSDMNILLFENEIPEIKEEKDTTSGDDKKDDEEKPITENPSVPSTSNTNFNYIGILEIPKLNLKRGFLDITSKYNNVDYNITVINSSTMPDQENNNLILAAHSGVCSYCYFNDLYKLSLGDVASVYYNGIKYNYNIVNIYQVPKTGKVSIRRNSDKNTLTLITCTRNDLSSQTVYILELVSTNNY